MSTKNEDPTPPVRQRVGKHEVEADRFLRLLNEGDEPSIEDKYDEPPVPVVEKKPDPVLSVGSRME